MFTMLDLDSFTIVVHVQCKIEAYSNMYARVKNHQF